MAKVSTPSFSCDLFPTQTRWESVIFYYGKFQDDCFKGLSENDQKSRCVASGLIRSPSC